MAATQQPTAEHYKRLTLVFKDAFDVVALIQLARFNLDGFHTNDFDTRTIDAFLMDLYDRLDQRDEWNKFLTAARSERKTKGEFVAVCDQVLAYLQTEPPTGDHRDDPMKSVLLLRRLPFVDREGVRAAITDMARDDGWCGLVLVGPKQVGKTYCHEYFAFLRLKKWGNDRLAQVILDQQRDYAMGPADLARTLVLAILKRDEPLPPRQPSSKEDRWASDLAVWLAAQVDLTGARAWVVLDGFDHPDVPPSTHSFIATLIQEATTRGNLRVVLLGYARVMPEHIERNVKREPLSFLTADEIQRFFDELERLRPFRAHPEYMKDGEPAEAFVRGYRALPADDMRVKAVKEALPKVVERLLQITAPVGGEP